MNLTKLARIVGLSMIVSISSLTAFAEPPAPQPCSCEYCSRVPTNRACILNGSATTCGTFLSFTTCGV